MSDVRGVCVTLLWLMRRWWFRCSWGDSFHTASKPAFKVCFTNPFQRWRRLKCCLHVGKKLVCCRASFIFLGLLSALAENEHVMGLSEFVVGVQLKCHSLTLCPLFLHLCMQDLTHLLRFGSNLQNDKIVSWLCYTVTIKKEGNNMQL